MWLNKATFAGVLTLASLIGATTQAAYVVTLEEEGSNVVATGSGTLDLTDLSFYRGSGDQSVTNPSGAVIVTGPISFTDDEYYTGITGPTSFGSGGSIVASSGSGNLVGVDGSGIFVNARVLVVPNDYISGSPLSDTSTYDDKTLASLGATPGVYTWTWGSGANADSFTLDIKAIPEPSTWAMMLLGFAGLGFAGYRQTRKGRAAIA